MKYKLLTLFRLLIAASVSLYKEFVVGERCNSSSVYLDLTHNFTLYTNTLVYHLAKGFGCIYIKPNPLFVTQIKETLELLKINNVYLDIAGNNKEKCDLVLTDKPGIEGLFISYDVFPIHEKAGTLLAPLSLYPNQVHLMWADPNCGASRSRSCREKRHIRVLFAGSGFAGGKYDDEEMRELFGLAPRTKQLESLVHGFEKGTVTICQSRSELSAICTEKLDAAVVIVDCDRFNIGPAEWRDLMASAFFFLALPGVKMPHCSNLIEAMMAGTVPITGYGDQMVPALTDQVNCLVARSEEELIDVVQRALAMPVRSVESMRKNVIEYYNNYIYPGKFISSLTSGQYSRIEVLAEHKSVDLFAIRKRGGGQKASGY